MRIPLIQVDAFAERRFAGNPAAVCPLDAWLDDGLLQAIAMENNLSETAYLVPCDPDDDVDFHLRWFTPKMEVDLCGHATLAAGFVVFKHLRSDLQEVTFITRSGKVRVRRREGYLSLDFPTELAEEQSVPDGLAKAMGTEPRLIRHGSRDWLMVYDDQAQIEALRPDFRALSVHKGRGVMVTAPGQDCDFVLRYFAPSMGIDEDPVTGSAYTVAGPYWAAVLGKSALTAKQLSQRGGNLRLNIRQHRILIEGRCVEVLAGEMILD